MENEEELLEVVDCNGFPLAALPASTVQNQHLPHKEVILLVKKDNQHALFGTTPNGELDVPQKAPLLFGQAAFDTAAMLLTNLIGKKQGLLTQIAKPVTSSDFITYLIFGTTVQGSLLDQLENYLLLDPIELTGLAKEGATKELTVLLQSNIIKTFFHLN